MILGNGRLPRFKIGDDLRHMAHQIEIETDNTSVPKWALSLVPGLDVEWVGCAHAWPHLDPDWAGKLFVGVAWLANHDLGDAKSVRENRWGGYEGWRLSPGTVFVVDPMTVHWLSPSDHLDKEPKPFLSLQWTVWKRDAKSVAVRLMEHLKAKWLSVENMDKRYAGWHP